MKRTEPDSINLGEKLVAFAAADIICIVLFRSWHDEAYLYINQAIIQEKPNIDRKDVALMMYQKGLGLLDLALCVDTEVGQNLDNSNENSCSCCVVSGHGSSLSQGEDDAAEDGEDSGACGVKD